MKKSLKLLLFVFLSLPMLAYANDDDNDVEREVDRRPCCYRCITTANRAICTAFGCVATICALAAWGGAYGRQHDGESIMCHAL